MSTNVPAYPRIPYGRASFPSVRREGCLYVDKTRFIHSLENERYVFFIRPRRFGKSFWIAMLECYYDQRRKKDFDALFADTDVGRNPTPNRNRYMILHFDFSSFNNALETLERNFENYCRIKFRSAVTSYPDLIPEAVAERLCAEPTINDKLIALFEECQVRGIQLYVLIDEYDNFANTILTVEGADAYHDFTHGSGFYRSFFATLKAGTSRGGSVDRLFVTGVSPITMDDVTSGFNIGTNVSLLPEFNEVLGFTEAEVRRLLETYREAGVFSQDVDATLDLMREWYAGYRFAKDAQSFLYNTDMVLYYLHRSLPNKAGPEDLIDTNIRVDYGKLRHLLLTGRQLNGNFDLLREAIGKGKTDCAIVSGFPLAQLPKRENYLSLLHYFGLLSIAGDAGGIAQLGVPNQTVWQLLYGHLRDAWRDVGVFSPDFLELQQLARMMAAEGAWRPAIERLSGLVGEQTGIRDYLQGEKAVQSFLTAYLSIAGCFVTRTEVELGKGYADVVLAPLPASHQGLTHGFVIELKYIARGEEAKSRVPELAAQAERQLRGYLADDRLVRLCPNATFTGLALVFQGWELAHAAEVMRQ